MNHIGFDRLHGGAPAGADVIDFSVSLNPCGTPPQVIEAYHRASEAVGAYPEPYAERLTAGLAQRLGVPPTMVLAGNGSTQLLYLIARVLHPARPMVIIPTFSEIANGLSAAGAPPHALPLREDSGFTLDREAFEVALLEGADAIFAGRPNSPTGTLISAAQTAEIAAGCAAHDCWCVFDEAFIDFADSSWSAAALIETHPRLIVTRSMTKLYAIPGLRLGYVLAQPAVIAELKHHLEPWSVSAPASMSGLACLTLPTQWHAQVRETVAAERTFLGESLGALPAIKPIPSVANFLMLRAEEDPAHSLGDYLLENGLMIRSLATLPGAGPGWYRIGVRLRADNQRLCNAIRAYYRR